MTTRVSRRELLRILGAGSAGTILAACAPKIIEVTKEVEVPVEVTTEVEVEVEKTVVVKETVVVPAGPTYEEGELKVLVCCYQDYEVDIRNEFHTVFQDEYPGLTVSQDLLPAGQNYFEKLQTLIAANTMPDIFDMWEGYVQPYAKNGVLLNLDPFFEADESIAKEDLVPAAIDGGSWEGSLYAFDINFMPGPCALFYNVDHFEAAGVEKPTSDWTWDDMRAAAQALTLDTNNDGIPEQWGVSWDLWFVVWLYWIWSNGGDLFSPDETKCGLSDPKAVEALQYWADLVNVDKVAAPASELQAMQGGLNAFQTGLISMRVGNFWDVGTLIPARDQGLNWGGVLSPKANDGNRTWYEHFQCWSIWTGSKMQNASWVYIRDFSPYCMPRFLDAGTLAIPGQKQQLYMFARPSIAEVGWDPLVTLATQPGMFKIPGAGERFDKISGMAQAELDLVFIGEKTAEQAAADACPKIDEELART